ncbi:hypothetical protein MMC34_007877 [Xylographa carneopallida]|nr:hypothetical protein [Xylographa carneopallida]
MSTTMSITETKSIPFILHFTSKPAIRAKPRNKSRMLRRRTPDSSLSYHLRTLYLFMASDLKTLLLPHLIFGIIGSISPAIVPSAGSLSLATILLRAIRVALWITINLLPFTIANQRLPRAIHEDAINKPWRPIPAGRLSPAQARELMLTGYVVAAAASAVLGGMRSYVAVLALAFCYNSLGGSDVSGSVRNLMNVAFYMCAMVGTIEVAAGGRNVAFSGTAWAWFALIGAVVLTTVHIQDLPDQEGDAARGRRTIPLEIGDVNARWSVVLLDLVWSIAAPMFWRKGAAGFVLPLGLAGVVAVRLFRNRSVKEDKVTLMIWSLWMMSLYFLPL